MPLINFFKAKQNCFFQINSIREEFIWPYYTLAEVFVTNPGNLSDPGRLAAVEKMVSDLEALSESYGPIATEFWIRDFRDYVTYSTGRPVLRSSARSSDWGYSETYLNDFLEWPEYEHWRAFVRLQNDK